ncbi:MAG: TetR family transcriptional regulator [Acidimicrobiales bacterium]
MSTLRERQRSATRAAIVEAFLDLTHADSAIVSMPAVADAAGVSVRTLYRYFATRSELQTAGANYFNDRARTRTDGELSTENFGDYLAALWTDFQQQVPAVIAEHATPAGRELRATRLRSSRATVHRSLRDAGVADPDDAVVDLVIALTSSSMFLELVDRMDHEPEDAAAMIERTVRLLLADLGA